MAGGEREQQQGEYMQVQRHRAPKGRAQGNEDPRSVVITRVTADSARGLVGCCFIVIPLGSPVRWVLGNEFICTHST